MLPRELLEKRLSEQEHVGASGAQRRHRELHDVDPVVEILAERTVLDAGHEIAMGRRDQAHVEWDLLVPAQRAHGPRFECAQELGLHLEGHLPDLVEKERAVVGLHKEPFAVGARIGEGAADVTE